MILKCTKQWYKMDY